MKDRLIRRKKHLKILTLVILLLALPLILYSVYQIQNTAGRAASPDKLETEGGVLSGAVSKLTDSQASGGQYVLFASQTNSPTPTQPGPTSPPSTGNSKVYGPAFAATNKSNRQLREGAHAFRFKARNSGAVKYIRFQMTNRASPYGAGNGGTFKIGIQSLNGSGYPSGTWLGETKNYSPGIITNPQNFGVYLTYSNGPTLTKGQSYAIVVENIDSSPNSNYTSVNLPWLSGGTQSDQPYFDGDTVFLDGSFYVSPYAWRENWSHLPAFDIEYTNGLHEGMSGLRGVEETDRVGIVSSSSTSVWSFTYPTSDSSIQIDAINAWLWAQSGSGDASLVVKENGVNKATGIFSTSGEMGDGSKDWQRAVLSSVVTLTPERTYRVEISAPSGTTYYLPLMFWRDAGTNIPAAMQSFPYINGSNPHRADDSGGAVWSAWYPHTTFQMYAEVR